MRRLKGPRCIAFAQPCSDHSCLSSGCREGPSQRAVLLLKPTRLRCLCLHRGWLVSHPHSCSTLVPLSQQWSHVTRLMPAECSLPPSPQAAMQPSQRNEWSNLCCPSLPPSLPVPVDLSPPDALHLQVAPSLSALLQKEQVTDVTGIE